MQIRSSDLELMNIDLDLREAIIRENVYKAMKELPEPDTSKHIVATYFLFTTKKSNLQKSGEDIASHQTTAIHGAEPGSLVEKCTGKVLDTLPFDKEKRTGLVRIKFPTGIMLSCRQNREPAIYSTDILHIVSGAVQHEFKANADIKLVDVSMSEEILNMFPGPKYGPEGLREMAGLEPGEFMFGTIVKPCTGITAEEVAEIIEAAASNPFFSFVKEDENFHPNVEFAPLEARVSASIKAIIKTEAIRGKGKIIYAPHISSAPGELKENLIIAAKNGATAVMFSETYTGGAFRFARDLMADWDNPLAIYGHNGGIGSKTRSIWREVIDRFARLDGIDFRQTGPTGTTAYLRPFGLEWEMSEKVLTAPLGKHNAVMVTRAGGLDQGNIGVNLKDIKERGLDPEHYHFMAGSAINGWKDLTGKYDPKKGAIAMQQAVQAYRDGIPIDGELNEQIAALDRYAKSKGFNELQAALKLRYKTLF